MARYRAGLCASSRPLCDSGARAESEAGTNHITQVLLKSWRNGAQCYSAARGRAVPCGITRFNLEQTCHWCSPAQT